MQKKQFLFKKNIWLSLVIAAFSLVIISSCKGKGKVESFDMNCRQLKQPDIKTKWANNHWTQTGNVNLISQLRLKINKMGTTIQMEVDPMNGLGNIIPTGKIILTQEKNCYGTLPGDAEYGDSYLDFNSLKIVPDLSTGNLGDFDFIRLTPIQDYPPYVNFKVDVIKMSSTNTETIITSTKSWPCPPPEYCPKTKISS